MFVTVDTTKVSFLALEEMFEILVDSIGHLVRQVGVLVDGDAQEARHFVHCPQQTPPATSSPLQPRPRHRMHHEQCATAPDSNEHPRRATRRDDLSWCEPSTTLPLNCTATILVLTVVDEMCFLSISAQ